MKRSIDQRCARFAALAIGAVDATVAERERATQHVRSCPVCASALDADAQTALRLPTLSRPLRGLRVALAVTSVIQAALAARWLFGTSWLGDEITTAHLTRDGALGLAIASIGASATIRPRSSTALLGAGTIALLVQVVAAAVDGQAGWVSLSFEGVHVLNVTILGLLLVLARRQRISLHGPRRRSQGAPTMHGSPELHGPRRRRPPEPPTMRVVPDE